MMPGGDLRHWLAAGSISRSSRVYPARPQAIHWRRSTGWARRCRPCVVAPRHVRLQCHDHSVWSRRPARSC